MSQFVYPFADDKWAVREVSGPSEIVVICNCEDCDGVPCQDCDRKTVEQLDEERKVVH